MKIVKNPNFSHFQSPKIFRHAEYESARRDLNFLLDKSFSYRISFLVVLYLKGLWISMEYMLKVHGVHEVHEVLEYERIQI